MLPVVQGRQARWVCCTGSLRGPLLLLVEDLHWADRSTRDLLGFLVRNLRAGVALVLTYRPAGPA